MIPDDLLSTLAVMRGELEGRLMFERLALSSVVKAIERGYPDMGREIAVQARDRINRDLDRHAAMWAALPDDARKLIAQLTSDHARIAAVKREAA